MDLDARIQAFRNWWDLTGYAPLSTAEIAEARRLHLKHKDFRVSVRVILTARGEI